MRALNVLAALAACAGLAAAPGNLHAQSPQGHGIAGFWSMAPGPTPPRRAATPAEAELIAQFREGVLVLADAGATEFPPGDYGGLNVHASLREAAKRLRSRKPDRRVVDLPAAGRDLLDAGPIPDRDLRGPRPRRHQARVLRSRAHHLHERNASIPTIGRTRRPAIRSAAGKATRWSSIRPSCCPARCSTTASITRKTCVFSNGSASPMQTR